MTEDGARGDVRLRTGVCLFVRNEAREIAEWVVYHSLIGFDSFVIYDNASDDDTAEVLDRLRRVYDIKIIDWPRASKYSQLEAYDDCLKNFRDSFDWIAFIDADEFVVPLQHESIKDFLARFSAANAIALNWSVFGSAGHHDIPRGLVIEEFTRRAEEGFGPNLHTKMLVRPSKAIKVINPHVISVEGEVSKADGSFVSELSHGTSPTLAGFDVCRVNHYFVKSRAHWHRKMQRGYREGIRPYEHFEAHDVNDVEDRWAAHHANAVRQRLAKIEQLPLRRAKVTSRSASSDEEKTDDSWISVASQVDDVLYRAPAYAREPGNTLFDPVFYLATYPDVRASGIDAFVHFAQAGYDEGRRPCSAESLRRHVQA